MDGLRCLQFRFFAGSDFFRRCDQNDVTFFPHAQVLGIQDDVHRLVPRNIFQAQGQVSLNPVADHKVKTGEIGQYLQCVANRDLLEIQR